MYMYLHIDQDHIMCDTSSLHVQMYWYMHEHCIIIVVFYQELMNTTVCDNYELLLKHSTDKVILAL